MAAIAGSGLLGLMVGSFCTNYSESKTVVDPNVIKTEVARQIKTPDTRPIIVTSTPIIPTRTPRVASPSFATPVSPPQFPISPPQNPIANDNLSPPQ